MANSTDITIHGAASVELIKHQKGDTCEWATMRITLYCGATTEITVFEDAAIKDMLRLPKAKDFKTDFPDDEVLADEEEEYQRKYYAKLFGNAPSRYGKDQTPEEAHKIQQELKR